MTTHMPVNEGALGFGNPHHSAALRYAKPRLISDGLEAPLPTSADLFAMKSCAFFDRGINDPYASRDLEDLIALLDDCATLQVDVDVAEGAERRRIANLLEWLCGFARREDIVEGNLLGPQVEERAQRLWQRVEQMMDSLSSARR